MNTIIKRIVKQIGDDQLIDKLMDLKTSDFNSLMLYLFKNKTDEMTSKSMVQSFATNRFCVPSPIDPIAVHTLEIKLLEIARNRGIENLLLSPSAPLGSCSVFGCVDQNNVVSASRGTETLSDPSNMLAIILADGIKSKRLDNTLPIHYATTARVVRAQAFEGKGFYAHFGLFCMVSSGRDSGSYRCESELLMKHLDYYKTLFKDQKEMTMSIVLRKRKGYTDSDGFFDKMTELIKVTFPEIELSFDLDHEDNAYYKGINFKIYLNKKDEQMEIADGGFVNWISEMTENKKERCLISGVGIDRLLTLEEV